MYEGGSIDSLLRRAKIVFPIWPIPKLTLAPQVNGRQDAEAFGESLSLRGVKENQGGFFLGMGSKVQVMPAPGAELLLNERRPSPLLSLHRGHWGGLQRA